MPGAFVFGRTRTEKRADASGKVASTERLLPREQWAVLITGHHPGYVDWDAWQDIQARLRANCKPPRGDGGGAAREGAALLQGLLRCGRCGRMMQVGYSGTAGRAPVPVRPRQPAVWHHAVPEHRRSAPAPRRAGRAVPGAGSRPSLEATAQAMADAEQRPPRPAGRVRAGASSGPGSKPTGRCASTTRSSRRTGWSPAPWRPGWKHAWPPPRRAEADLPPPAARRPVPLTSEELAWITRAGADVRAVFDAPPPPTASASS